jgi:hypothetical protein
VYRLLYADLTNQKLRRTLGGSDYSFPKLPSKSTLRLALRFSEQVGTTHVDRHPTIVELRAAIGPVDLSPDSGTLTLKVGTDSPVVGTNVTTALTYPFTAAQLADALNVLSVVGTAVVAEDAGTFVISGVTGAITAYTNKLRPISFARVEAYEEGGVEVQALRMQRAPYAFADSYDQKVPDGPTIERVQAGGDADGVEWNEIQKLTVPRDFLGSYLIKANDEVARTGLLGIGDGPEQVAEAMNPTATGTGVALDGSGLFIVTEHPTEPAMFIEFAGSMAGAAQDLLKVAVFDAPDGDFYLDLDLNTAPTSQAFRDSDEVTAVLEIFADIEDPDDDEIIHENVPVFRGTVTIVESVVHADMALPQDIDWINPPQAKQYAPVSPDSITSGSRYYDFLIAGDEEETEFQITHSLDSPRVRIHLRENITGGRDLVPGADYEVVHDDDDAVTITFLGDYATDPPALNAISGTAQDLRVTSTWLGHTHPISEITGLQTILDNYAAAIAALQGGDFGGGAPPAATVTAGKIDRPLRRVWNILRARELPATPGSLVGWDPFGEGSTLRDIRLLPAVHVASGSIEALPAILPAPAAVYRDRVFYSAVDVPGLLSAGQYAACTGLEWYRVRRESTSESTWYPTAMEMEFFRLSISPDELALRTRLDLAIGLEMALYDPSRRPADRRTVGRMSLILERGVRVSDSSPSTTGSNISSHFGSPVILAQHDFDLTSEVAQKKFTLSVARDGAGTLTALASKMMGAAVTVSPPASADFALRLRLARVDFENLPTDGRGILAVRGPDVGLDGKVDQTVGRYGIS